MSTTELRVTVVDADLVGTTGMWGDASGGWQPPATAWVGRLAALGVRYDVRAGLDRPVDGLVVDPTGSSDVAGDDVLVGAPPETGRRRCSCWPRGWVRSSYRTCAM